MVKTQYKQLNLGVLLLILLTAAIPQSDLQAAVFEMPVAGVIGTGIDAAALRVWDRNILSESKELISDLSASGKISMIFSAHNGREDAEWIIYQIRQQLENVDSDRPVVIWLEHAEPLGLPKNIQELQTQFQNPNGCVINWYQALTQREVSEKSIALLHALFQKAVEREGDPLPYFMRTQDPFAGRLRKGIEELKDEGWNIQIQIEKPTFEAYLQILQRDALSRMASYWLSQKRGREAFAGLALAYRSFSKSLDLRDRVVAGQVMSFSKAHPETFQIVTRGTAHAAGMERFISEQKLTCDSVIQETGSENKTGFRNPHAYQYFLKYRQMPSLDTPQGRKFLLNQLQQISSR